MYINNNTNDNNNTNITNGHLCKLGLSPSSPPPLLLAERVPAAGAVHRPTSLVKITGLHPVRNPRFGSFRTQPLENLSAAVKLPIKTSFWATQPLEQILVREILLCELGVIVTCAGPQVPCQKDLQDLGRKSDQTTGQLPQFLVLKTAERKKDPSGPRSNDS